MILFFIYFILSLLSVLMVIVLVANLILGPLKPPSELAHLPEISQWSLLLSFLCKESLDVRYERLYKPVLSKYGMARMRTQGRWELIVGDGKLARDMLCRHKDLLKRNPDDDQSLQLLVRRMFGLINITISDNEEWRRHRRVSNPGFKTNMDFTVTMSHLVEYLDNNLDEPVQVLDLMRRVTVDALGLELFDFDLKALELGESHYSVKNYGNLLFAVANPIFFAFPMLEDWIPSRKQDHLSGKAFREYIRSLIHQRKNQIKQGRLFKGDLLTLLVQDMLSEDGLSEEEIIDDLVAIFVAGHDTISNGLTTALYYLAKNQDIQTKTFNHIHSKMKSDYHLVPTIDQLRSMDYLEMVIKESLRIVTPVGQSRRYCHHQVELPNLIIPANTSVNIENFLIHRDENIYPDPDQFRPNRFENPHSEAEQSWYPFGVGTRMCAGKNYAMMEMRALLATIIQRYQIIPGPNIHSQSRPTFNNVSLVHPEGVDIILQPRS